MIVLNDQCHWRNVLLSFWGPDIFLCLVYLTCNSSRCHTVYTPLRSGLCNRVNGYTAASENRALLHVRLAPQIWANCMLRGALPSSILLIFNWFIPVVCEYNVKYLRDIRRVRQNTTLHYDATCHRTDNMFRPFNIRPSSGLTSTAKEETVKL